METKKTKGSPENVKTYELQAPDGGWGYVIVIAVILSFSFTVIPMTAFGLIFGNFLQTIGDETTGTTLSNGIFNTVNSFTGLLANGVLNRYSYRKVGLAGTAIYFLGAVGLIFSQNLYQLITFFGVIQGLGFGLIMPAVLSAFNSYFKEKMAVMMGIAQGAMVLLSMFVPYLVTWSMDTLGFRWTLTGMAGLVLLCFPAVATLQPVKWHMKKVPITTSNDNTTDILKSQMEPLMNNGKELSLSQGSLHKRVIHPVPRLSIISLGDRVASVTTINDLRDDEAHISKEKELSIWQSFIKSMDMSLLKDFKYLNVSIGLAFCFTSDVAFISIIPLMLGNVGFQSQEIAFIMMVYFGADLVSRIIFTIISGIFTLRSRHVMLFAAFFSVIFRTALVYNNSYMWKMSVLAVLGFLRCFIQTPLPLVISEEYPDRFSTAFSLYMAVNGVVSIVFGVLMSSIKSYTQSDVMVCHALTLAYCTSVIAWTTEILLCRTKSETGQKK